MLRLHPGQTLYRIEELEGTFGVGLAPGSGLDSGKVGCSLSPSRTDGEDATEFLFSGRDRQRGNIDAQPEQRCGLDLRGRSTERLAIEHRTHC